MKNLFFALLTVSMLSTAFVAPKPKINDIEWNETTHNFGDVPLGPEAKFDFVFKIEL